MPNNPLAEHHQWVTHLFQTLLHLLGKLDFRQDSPKLFLVYAHDHTTITQESDAEIARQLIQWLRDLGATIYSDRTAAGKTTL